jgi:hypothetical protein
MAGNDLYPKIKYYPDIIVTSSLKLILNKRLRNVFSDLNIYFTNTINNFTF